MLSLLNKRYLAWVGILCCCVLVGWNFLFPVAMITNHYAHTYGNAFIDAAPGILFKDKEIEFIGADSVTVPLENNMQFIFNSQCDSMILIDTVPGSVALSQKNIFIRLKSRVLALEYGSIHVNSDSQVVQPKAIRAAIIKYSGAVIVILSLIIMTLLFLCFLLLSLTAAGVCSIIDSMVETTLNFSTFFHLSGSLLLFCVGIFILSRMNIHQIKIMILIYFLMIVAFCFILIKQNKKPQLSL
jgi:hypothetical protein